MSRKRCRFQDPRDMAMRSVLRLHHKVVLIRTHNGGGDAGMPCSESLSTSMHHGIIAWVPLLLPPSSILKS